MSKPMPNGTTNAMAYVEICRYGTARLPRSKIVLPSVKIHNGIMAVREKKRKKTHKKFEIKYLSRSKFQKLNLPNAANVLVVVIATDKSIFPPRITVQMFDAPPAGETPVKNNPNCMSTLSGNRIKPNT